MPTRIAPETSHDELATFLKDNHTALVDLLPEDTDASDLFKAVQYSKPLARFFDVDEAANKKVVERALERLEMDLQGWLGEETACGKKRRAEKAKAARATKHKRTQDEEPPPPPQMDFADAQLVHEQSVAERLAKRRRTLLEKGWTGKFVVPAKCDTKGTEHIAFFKEDPSACCAVFGADYQGMTFGSAKVHFDSDALVAFEETKRRQKPPKGQRAGKPAFPHTNFSLQSIADPNKLLTWQDFFGTLVSGAYRESDTVAFKMAKDNTVEELDRLAGVDTDAIKAKFAGKLTQANRKIAIVDTMHAKADAGPVKDALCEELKTKRATRDAVLASEKQEVDKINAKYDSLKETRALMDARKERLQKRANERAAALHTRGAAGGGTTAADGAAAIDAVNTATPVRMPVPVPVPVTAEVAPVPYKNHEEVDADKPISMVRNEAGELVEPSNDEIKSVLLSHLSKLKRMKVTPIEHTIEGSLSRTVLEVAHTLDIPPTVATVAGENEDFDAELNNF